MALLYIVININFNHTSIFHQRAPKYTQQQQHGGGGGNSFERLLVEC